MEAEKEGATLIDVEWQSAKYVDGLPEELAVGRTGVCVRVDRH